MATAEADARILACLCHGSSTGVSNAQIALRRKEWLLYVPAEGSAGATSQRPHAYLPKGITGVSAKIYPFGAMTANDTNYATIGIGSDDGAAGTFTSVADVTTKSTGGTGNWTAGTAVSFSTFTPADTIAAGVYLGIKIAKAASGVQLPAFLVHIIADFT